MKHRWGPKTVFEHKTERACERCGVMKVTRSEHEGGHDVYWTEFYAAGGFDRIEVPGTPVCEPVEVPA